MEAPVQALDRRLHHRVEIVDSLIGRKRRQAIATADIAAHDIGGDIGELQADDLLGPRQDDPATNPSYCALGI